MKAGIVRRFGAGEIAEVGAGVTDREVGQRVVLLPTLVCGSCEACGPEWT